MHDKDGINHNVPVSGSRPLRHGLARRRPVSKRQARSTKRQNASRLSTEPGRGSALLLCLTTPLPIHAPFLRRRYGLCI